MRAMPAPDTLDDDGHEAWPFPPDLHDVRHLQLKGGLLVVWATVSFGACYFARDLTLMFGGWQLGYWIASQGALLVFMAVVVFYAWAMKRFERAEADPLPPPGPAGPPGPRNG